MLTFYVVQLLLGGHLDLPEVPFDLNKAGLKVSQGIRRSASFRRVARVLKNMVHNYCICYDAFTHKLRYLLLLLLRSFINLKRVEDLLSGSSVWRFRSFIIYTYNAQSFNTISQPPLPGCAFSQPHLIYVI